MSPRTKEQVEEIREASKSKILEAALELFAMSGYDSTSISKIAEKAGVSKGLMYNYFTSKEDLLKGLIDHMNKEESNIMGEVMDEDPSKMLENIIRLFFRELRDNYQHWVFISKLVLQIDKFDFIKSLATDKYNNYLALFEQLLTAIGISNPGGESKLLGALFDGIGYQYIIIQSDYPLDEIEDYLIQKYCTNENY